MKKALWSAAVAAMLMFTLNACADTPAPVQTGDSPPQATVESTPTPTVAGESAQPVLSAGNTPLAEDSTANEGGESKAKLELPAEPSPTPAPQTTPTPKATPAPQVAPAPQAAQVPQPTPTPHAPQETPAPAKGTIQFNVTTQKGAGESPSPAPSAAPEPEHTPAPTPPAQSEPPVSSQAPEPAFSIDRWLAYAKDYARGAGLNLDPTATACWDNPIAAGAHCAYLERDIQSRLNRYARDETISDVWIWAESRSDGGYDLYIGYA